MLLVFAHPWLCPQPPSLPLFPKKTTHAQAADGFWEDLAKMKQIKADWAQECQKYANMDVDDHRRKMLGEKGPTSAEEMKCHLLQLDSEGFVKYLKQWTGVPHMECHRQGRPLKAYIFVPLLDSGSEMASNMFHRYALRHGLRPAVPVGDSRTYGYPQTDLVANVQKIPANLFSMKQPGPARQPKGFDLIASGQMRLEMGELNKLIPGAVNPPNAMTTILRDPAEHFWSVWNEPQVMLLRLQSFGSQVTPDVFLKEPKKYLELLPASVVNRLRNGQAYALGLSSVPRQEDVQQLTQSMHSRFSTVMISEYIDESLVLARRVLCWTPEDTSYPIRPPARSAKKDLSRETIAAIKEFNWADDLIYTVFNSTLHATIKREINFQVEVETLREERAAVAKKCNQYSKMTDGQRLGAMRKVLQGKRKTSAASELMKGTGRDNVAFQCHTAYMGTPAFVALFKTVWSMDGEAGPIAKDDTFGGSRATDDEAKQLSKKAGKGGAAVVRKDVGGTEVAAAPDPNSVDAPPPNPSQECAAQKFIYLKTHKTGSSTILSILHRYSFKYQLNSALPIDNMYLGWPTRKGALNSFTSIRGVTDYDVFASGHSTWSHNYLREIVPVGKQITILREPVSQFVSSWNHWHPYEHIVGMGGPDLTMTQFLDSPEKYWKYAKWSDEALLHNSYSYDFGITSKPKQSDVDGIIKAMENEFDLVMITEYMDESLIMLRRLFCWDMEDILHFSMKVTKAKHQHSSGAATKDELAIRKLNWADVQIYDALNKTFWKKMEPNLKDPTFQLELDQLRAGRELIGEKCKVWENYEEDFHRLKLASGKANPDGCNLYLLDSKGFVKMLKRRVGIQTSECRTVSVFPMKEIVFASPRWVPNAKAATNMIYRAGIKLGHFPSRILTPPGKYDQDTDVHWDNADTLKLWVQGKGKAPVVAAEPFSRYRKSVMEKVVASAYLVAMVEDPVTHFLRAWQAQTKSDPQYKDTEPLDFFTNPGKYPTITTQLKNPQTWDLAGTRNPSPSNANAVLQDIKRTFPLVMVADRLQESLIMLRRQQCYDRLDAITLEKSYKDKNLPKASEQLVRFIHQFNAADVELHKFFTAELDRRIGLELYMQEEVEELASWNEEAIETCDAVTKKKQSVHIEWLLKHPASLRKAPFVDKGGQSPKEDSRAMLTEAQCHLMALKPESFRELIHTAAQAGVAGMQRGWV